MHISNDTTNFRNDKYLQELELNFKQMFRAYYRYIAYRNKLLNELTLSNEQKIVLSEIDRKFVKNVNIASKRVNKDDFKGNAVL